MQIEQCSTFRIGTTVGIKPKKIHSVLSDRGPVVKANMLFLNKYYKLWLKFDVTSVVQYKLYSVGKMYVEKKTLWVAVPIGDGQLMSVHFCLRFFQCHV